MSKSSFVIIAEIRAASGQEAKLAQRLTELLSPMRSLPSSIGLQRYMLSRNPAAADSFYLYEEWLDQAHFETFIAHHQPPALQRFFADAGTLLREPPAIRQLQPLG